MGIHGLSKVIGDNANEAIKEDDIKNYFGRKVAIDASMSIYQFMIAVRQQDGQLLQNENGETTRYFSLPCMFIVHADLCGISHVLL